VVVAAVLLAGSEKAAAHRLGLAHPTVKHHLANARSAEAGDTLSETAAAHGLTLAALLAFENAKYRAKPGLIHPGDIVRVN
jgi:DNA-binding transcriptional regulator YdaS (Cro superfamily)